MKTATVPTAAASKEAESSHDSITVTSYISNAADEIGSGVSFGGKLHVIQAASSFWRSPREAQTLKA